MGFFVHLKGRFECVRCKHVSEAWIQTKLLRSDIDNNSHAYSVGDSEILDGLDGYCPLHPWNQTSPLVVAIGDWACDYCNLNWQWAKATFKIQAASQSMIATIVELSTLQPFRGTELDGIHYVESELAELSGLWEQRQYNWRAGFINWQGCSAAERSERVASGYRAWCHEVAGISTPE